MSIDVTGKACQRCGGAARGAVLIIDPQRVTVTYAPKVLHVEPPPDLLLTALNNELADGEAVALCLDCLQAVRATVESRGLLDQLADLQDDYDFLHDRLEQVQHEAEEALAEATKDHVRVNWHDQD